MKLLNFNSGCHKLSSQDVQIYVSTHLLQDGVPKTGADPMTLHG